MTPADEKPPGSSTRRRWVRRGLAVLAAVALLYVLLAYVVLPALWTHHEHEPALADLPMVTRTAQGIPGDPLNVGLVGSREEVIRALHAGSWYPADAITLKTSIEIAGSVLFDRPYRDAPVSNLFYDGRREDLAFEKPAGESADRRHHVRFWHVLEKGRDGRPVWLGAVTFDRGVGVSHLTGAITHHIAPDVDAERDELIAGLDAARMLTATHQVSGAGPTLNGRNGGGDRYFTDGEIAIGVISGDAQRQTEPAENLPNPSVVALKNAAWSSLKGLLNGGE
jgi:hypothetical protein